MVPPIGRRARLGVEFVKRRSPAVVRGVWPSASIPDRLLNPGCKQLALPLTVMPVAQLLPLHCVGMEVRAVAVAAFPEVLLEMAVGRSVAANARKVGVAAGPEFGPARTLLAACVSNWGANVPLVVVGEPGTVGLKMMPSPVIPTLVTDPEPVPLFETNNVRTSVSAEILLLVVTTVAMGIAAPANPVVFDAGAQLRAGSRYT